MRHPYRAGRRNVFHIQDRHRALALARTAIIQLCSALLTLVDPDVADVAKSEKPF